MAFYILTVYHGTAEAPSAALQVNGVFLPKQTALPADNKEIPHDSCRLYMYCARHERTNERSQRATSDTDCYRTVLASGVRTEA